jgi:ribosomal protein S18 acetylase RimI-like enzyme
VNLRRLGRGDEEVVIALAEQTAPTPEQAGEFLADDRMIFLVAFDGREPMGFLFGYELLRRHGDRAIFFVYEVEVREGYRRRGAATKLFAELERIVRDRGIRRAFVLAAAGNEPAMRLYESVGGVRPYDDDVVWRFEYTDD